MLIQNLNKYLTIPIRGAIHIGAHRGEESKWYQENNIKPIVWIECNEDYKKDIEKNANKEDIVIITCVGNENKTIEFNVANNGQSSSILDLDRHKLLHPEVFYTNKKSVSLRKMNDLIKEYSIQTELYNFLNIDIQGYELEALKGFEGNIDMFDYLYMEVNATSVYKNCASIFELDTYLEKYNFKRSATVMWNQDHGWNEWGDAFYTKI